MLIISLYTAQNMIHLEFNFSLLILDKTSMEAVALVASMLVTVLKWHNKYLTVFYHYINFLSCSTSF